MHQLRRPGLDGKDLICMQSVFRIQWLFWTMMLMGVLIYVVVGLVAGTRVQPAGGEAFLEKARAVCCVLSVVFLLLAAWLQRKVQHGLVEGGRFFRWSFSMLSFTQCGSPGVVCHHAINLVCWGLMDLIAMFGLILYMLGDQAAVLYSFAILATAALIFFRPQWDLLEDAALREKRERGEDESEDEELSSSF